MRRSIACIRIFWFLVFVCTRTVLALISRTYAKKARLPRFQFQFAGQMSVASGSWDDTGVLGPLVRDMTGEGQGNFFQYCFADGSVGVRYARARLLEIQKGKSRGKGKEKDSGKPNMPDLRRGCSPEARLLVQHHHWMGRGERQAQDKSKGKDGKDKTSTNTQQQSNKDKKSVKCWNCNAQGHVAKDCLKKKQSLSAVESQEQPPSSSGATGETTLSGSFLDACEEEAELNSFESKIAGVLVTGIDSGAARSVVPGEIHGYCVERVSETGRVSTSGETAHPGNSGRKGARLEHASRASQEESHERVYDMCAAGHVSCSTSTATRGTWVTQKTS